MPQRLSLFLCGVGKTSPRTLYSVDVFFSYSGPSGILGSDRKQKTAQVGARGMRFVALSINSH